MKKGNLNSSSSEEEKDWISSLPDSIIERILSFIDMKFAVQTCVLSTRWRYTWTFLPVLNLCDYYHSTVEDSDDDGDDGVQTTKRFIKFVDRVLSLRDKKSDIRRFDLSYGFYFNNTDEICGCIDRWIATAVSHNVQEMCICLIPDEDFEIPLCLCTCKSLTKLKLELLAFGYSDYDSEIILPEDCEMSLPVLKSLILILEHMSIGYEDLTNRFFASFPSLESLIMEVGHIPFTEKNINISLPKLKHFEFDSWDSESNCEVKLHAPSLSSFIFRSYLSTNLRLMNLSSLATANIEIHVGRSEVPEICAQRAMGLLRGIHNVEVLTLDDDFLEALGGAPDILDTQPTEHFNIQHLKLQTYLSRDRLRSIFFILNNSPNIESILLQVKSDPDDIGDYRDARLSLLCRMCHLKIVEIKGLSGHAIELIFLELLLKHATVLEKVVLTSSTKEDSEREKRMVKFSEMLLTFPTASKKILILLKF